MSKLSIKAWSSLEFWYQRHLKETTVDYSSNFAEAELEEELLLLAATEQMEGQ